MEILKEDLENLEKVDATTTMNITMGTAKEGSKTLWQRLEDAEKLPEDAPLFGAKDQPVPEEVEEPKIKLEESLFMDIPTDVEKELYDLFDENDFDIEHPDVQNYIQAAIEYIKMARDNGESDYSALDWWRDTMENYPQDLEALPGKYDNYFEEDLNKSSKKSLNEAALSIRNFSSDIGRIVYALTWYAENIFNNLDNDKYADHFDSPERLGKAAQISIKALDKLSTLMTRKMGYEVSSGGDFLDTGITKKPAAMSQRIGELRDLLYNSASTLINNSPDPRVKNNNNLKVEVGDLIKGLRSSLGTLASEVNKVKQGETKGLFGKKFKEGLEDNGPSIIEIANNAYDAITEFQSLYDYMLDMGVLEEDETIVIDDALEVFAQIEGRISDSINEQLYEDAESVEDDVKLSDEVIEDILDDVKGVFDECEFTTDEVVDKIFDCIADESKVEFAQGILDSMQEDERSLTESVETFEDSLTVIKKYFNGRKASEVIDTIFTNNPAVESDILEDIALKLGQFLDDYLNECKLTENFI